MELCKKSNVEKAKKFLEFMKTEQARAVMKRYGFTLPEEKIQS